MPEAKPPLLQAPGFRRSGLGLAQFAIAAMLRGSHRPCYACVVSLRYWPITDLIPDYPTPNVRNAQDGVSELAMVRWGNPNAQGTGARDFSTATA